MLAVALLSSLLAISDDPAGAFTCSDAAFTIRRTGENGVLQGTLIAPQQGFTYHFMQSAPQGAETTITLTAGQPITQQGFGHGLPAIEKRPVMEKIALPPEVARVHIRIEGLSAAPQNITCTTPPPAATS